MAKTHAHLKITQRDGRSIGEILRDQADRRLSPEQCAAELGVSVGTARRWIEDQGGRIVRTISIPHSKEDTNAATSDRCP